MKRLAVLVLAAMLVATACSGGEEGIVVAPDTTMAVAVPTQPSPAALPLQRLETVPVAEGLDRPVALTAPAGDERLFIVEQPGRVRVVKNGALLDVPFLKVESQVGSTELEQGMLDVAFHPRYADNGRFFVSYTNVVGDSRVVEYSADPAADVADLSPGRVVLAIDQPHMYHNGGQLRFGPDGYLWISLGDGGGVEDTFGNGQRPDTLLGTLLRIDVNHRSPYSLPPDNPYVDGVGGAPEVWAYGLRNPWRFVVDPLDRMVYVADVGQADYEEIDVVPMAEAGLNFGWPIFEGKDCFVPMDVKEAGGTVECVDTGFEEPVLSYSHRQGCAVVGGPVYRGQEIPELWGHYLYGDWCGGWVKSFRYEDESAVDHKDWSADIGDRGPLLSIGTDGLGELYLGFDSGTVYRVEAVR